MAKRDPAKTRYCSHGRVLRDKAGRLAAEGIKEMGDGEAGRREYWTPGSPGTMPGLDFLWQW